MSPVAGLCTTFNTEILQSTVIVIWESWEVPFGCIFWANEDKSEYGDALLPHYLSSRESLNKFLLHYLYKYIQRHLQKQSYTYFYFISLLHPRRKLFRIPQYPYLHSVVWFNLYVQIIPTVWLCDVSIGSSSKLTFKQARRMNLAFFVEQLFILFS